MPFAGGGEGQDLRARPVLDRKGKVDVGPVKAAQEGRGFCPVEQFLHNLGAGFRISGGGEGGQWHVEKAAQFADAQVIGAEIMAPLANAMRLVDRDHCDANPAQHLHGAASGQTFGRHIKQPQGAGL